MLEQNTSRRCELQNQIDESSAKLTLRSKHKRSHDDPQNWSESKDSYLHIGTEHYSFSERVPFAYWCFRKSLCVNTSLFVLSSGGKMKHKNFFIVPNQIFELGLKPKEFVVYCCLLRHSDKNTDNCFPSRRLIADECSMDKKTVDSALKELEARGLIKKVCRYRENGSRTSNMYYLASLLE